MTDQPALLAYSKVRLDILQAKYCYLPIGVHDWNDIKQDILIRIWKKSDQIDWSIGYKAWINVLIANTFKNRIRDIMVDLKRLNPKPVISYIKQDGICGEEVICEPDISEPKTAISKEDKEAAQRIIDLLPARSKKILELYQSSGCWTQVAREVKQPMQTVRSLGIKTIRQIKEGLSQECS